MFRTPLAPTASVAGILLTVLLTGCGTSSSGPGGSKHQTMTGISESGYPAGAPKDAQSPALSSSTEQANSHAGAPKVPIAEGLSKAIAKDSRK